MNSIDILVLGHLERNEDGSVIPDETWSTSTLIRTDDGHNIVVDTSRSYMKPAIKTSLKQIGKVFPEDVDILVLTHAHEDHIGNNEMFKNAKIYIHKDEEFDDPKAIKIDKETVIAKGVRILPTPGHSAGSVSVFVDADRHYAVVGDAAPLKDNFTQRIVPKLNVDPEAAMRSIEKIAAYADVIIPGHDQPFRAR